MFSIAPIGSCRIATPLRLARSRYGFALNRTRSLGFTHSSAEAVQAMRLLHEDLTIPEPLWPLVARDVDRDATLATPHEPADLYIVEISSAKRITLDGLCLQHNYFSHAFKDMLASPCGGRGFWDRAASGDQAAIDSGLAGWDRPDEVALLRQVRLARTTLKDLRANITTLMNRLPQVLFVTHVNAVKPDRQPIASRAAFIEEVKHAVRSTGGEVFDPTPLMQDMGQINAIEDYSDGLAHFTDDFGLRVAEAWMDRIIAPAIDRATLAHGTANTVLAPHVTALLEAGQLRGLSDRLFTLAEALPDDDRLSGLQCDLALAERKADDALGALTRRIAHAPLDIRALLDHADLALTLGRFEAALASERQLATTESGRPGPDLIRVGRRAVKAGCSPDLAADYFRLAFQSAPKMAATALAQLALEHDIRLFRLKDDLDSRTLCTEVSPELALRLLQEPRSGLRAEDLLFRADELGADALADLIDWLTERSATEMAVLFIKAWSDAHGQRALEALSVQAALDRWLDRAARIDDPVERLAILGDLKEAHPRHTGGRIALRETRRDVVAQIREWAAAGDLQALTALETRLPAVIEPIADLPLFQARLSHAAGDHRTAMRKGLEAVMLKPDNLSIWALLMRSASAAGDRPALLRFAAKVRDLSDEATRRLGQEAESHLAGPGIDVAQAPDLAEV